MKPLAEIVEKHPLSAGFVGTISGWAGWSLDQLGIATQIVSFIGACAGTATAVLGLIIFIRNSRRK